MSEEQLQLQDISQTENLLDDGKFKIKLQKELYNLFIDPSKMKSTIDIGNAISKDFEISNQNRGSGTERYILPLSQDIAYGLNVIRKVTATLEATNVKYSYNKQYLADYIQMAPPATLIPVQQLTDTAGLPHPFLPGISGWICDPLNSAANSITLSFGGSQTPIPQPLMTPAWVNTRRHFTSKEVLEDPRFHGLLYPEKAHPSIMAMESNKFRVIPYPMSAHVNWTMRKPDATVPVIGDICYPMLNLANTGMRRPYVSNTIMTLDEVNNEYNNQFSIHRRGTIFKYANYIFKKTVPSKNYKFTTATIGGVTYGYLVPLSASSGGDSAPTTDLYDMALGDGTYHFQSDVQNWKEALTAGIDPYYFMWYYNMPGRVFKVTGVDADGVITSAVVADGYGENAATQSLNITINFNLTGPVLSPLLDSEVQRTFCGVQNGNLDIIVNSDLQSLFKIIGGAGNTSNGTDIIPSGNSDGTLSVKFDEQKIVLRSYKMEGLQPFIKNYISLPYMQSSITQTSLTTRVNTPIEEKSIPVRNFEKQRITTTVMNIGNSIPRYLLVYCDFPLAYKITNFEINFAGTGNAQLLDIKTLMNATKRNGMSYSNFDEDGYPIVNNCTHNENKLVVYKSLESATPVGSLLFLKFGSDITLPYGLYPGMTGNTCSIQYTFDIEFPEEYVTTSDTNFDKGQAFVGNLYVDHLSEYDYVISENSAETKGVNINNVEAASALQLTIDRIKGNYFSSSRSRLYTGGNFITDAFRSARNVGARLVSPVTGAVKAYKAAHNFLDKQKGKVHAVDNFIMKYL